MLILNLLGFEVDDQLLQIILKLTTLVVLLLAVYDSNTLRQLQASSFVMRVNYFPSNNKFCMLTVCASTQTMSAHGHTCTDALYTHDMR